MILSTPISGQTSHRVITPGGTVEQGTEIIEGTDFLLSLYKRMVFVRLFDRRLLNLQRQGQLTVYTPIIGQEAVLVGCACALRHEDWLIPSYRDGMASIMHGLPAEYLLHFFRCHPKGTSIPDNVNVLWQQISVGEQIPHAVGIAWGMKLRRSDAAALVLFGDGATSEGAFHEGLNLAGVVRVPVVFVCQNNGWAISLPSERQTASATIAQKAIAYGMPGERVDGNDVLAVYRTTSRALQRAREGGGPTLLEAVTCRPGPHSTADDPTRYRSQDEVAQWSVEHDPLQRLKTYLVSEYFWGEEQQQALEASIQEQIAEIVLSALSEPLPSVESVFDSMYAHLPSFLQAQRQEVLQRQKETARA